ncbi:MAG TPA: amino acid adenylation domain-containing protein, partial [Tepidisphaeraceae bacterium]|nr:amino acid adenylation domain-containing protein [Tepidisphaeraceae bacterium]
AKALAGVARAHGVTAFTTYLAAFNVLLHRLTSQEDLIIGTPLAGRSDADVERLIGLFINLLPVRTRVTAQTSFGELLQRVHESTIQLLAESSVPFDRLVQELQIDRDPSRPPLCGVVFNFHNVAGATSRPKGLDISLEDLDLGTARFDLMLTLRPQDGGSHLAALEYSRDLFEPATADLIARRFLVLLQSVAKDASAAVGDLPIMDRAEIELLERWAASSPHVPEPVCCAHETFEQQVRKTPDAVALVCGDERLTYSELNRRANRLAWQLREFGVGPDTLVAICLKRTSELPIAVLAVLKAGGAYVPLDPAYPTQRIAYMLEESRAALLLTEREFAGLFEPLPLRRVVCIEETRALTARDENPPARATLDDLAYVIYTSGSTGRPKGVAIEHRGPAALLDWAARALPDSHIAGMLFSTSVCFDLSVFELLVPLARGGKIILVPNVLELPSCPAAAEVTFINTVPSAMTELLRIDAVPKSVRAIGLAGEALPAALARRCHEIPGLEALYNLYGPTEDTVYSTARLVERNCVPDIGRPIGGTRALILDSNRRPVPIGVHGELYLGGIKLARGYLHRPELTEERFVLDAHAPTGARLYRTGDLCRWNADGSIQYLGRIDHQVKLRGFRIELAEIEAVLGSHPGVRQCIVIAQGEGGDARLVAYFVPRDPAAAPDSAGLKSHLSAQVPAYMVPAVFVRLESMPLTPNGKIDRRSLPVPSAADRSTTRAFVAPAGAAQETLAQIWRDVLRLDRIGATDGFFELGGHSLGATIILTRIHQAFGVELPLRAIFEHPTVAALAGRLEHETPANQQSIVSTNPSRPDRPLSFGQQRLWFLDRLDPAAAAYNVVSAQTLRGPLDVPRLESALNAVVARHDVLRTGFPEVQGVPSTRVLPIDAIRVPITIQDLRGLSSEEGILARLRGFASAPFDLSAAPLLHAVLLRVGENEHVFAIAIHHIVCDDWSVRLLLDEMSAIYSGRMLAPLRIQYGDFAQWQRDSIGAADLQAQMAWWRENLRHAPATFPLPTDRPRPALQTFRGGVEKIELSIEAMDALRTLAKDEGSTVFIALMACFNLLLSKWTGASDLVVGTPVASRQRPEAQPLIGFFLNTLPMRTRLSAVRSFRDLLSQVRRTALDAYERQHVPFEFLIDALQLPRDPGRSPLFQVMLVLLNESAPTLSLPGIESSVFRLHAGTSKFDLSLMMREERGVARGYFEYNADLFDAGTIRELARRFVELVRTVVADPDRPIDTSAATAPTAPHLEPATSPAPAPGRRAPRHETERELARIWRELLGVESLSIDDSFFDLGGHSLLAVRMMHEVKRQFGRPLPLARLFTAPTIAKLAAALDAGETAAPANELVVQLRAGDGRPPLFCLPGAGGHAFSFLALARRAAEGQPIYGLHFRGLDLAGGVQDRIEDMAAGFLQQVRAIQPGGPYRFAGYSFGGVVAYEMARQLVAAGERVDLVALFDGHTPGAKRLRPPHERLMIHAGSLLEGGWRGAARYLLERVTRLRHRARPASLRSDDGPPDDSPLADAIRRVGRAAEHAFETYRPQPYPGKIVLFRAASRPEWHRFLVDRPFNGWDEFVRGGVDVHPVPGTHYTLLQEPNVQVISDVLNQWLS